MLRATARAIAGSFGCFVLEVPNTVASCAPVRNDLNQTCTRAPATRHAASLTKNCMVPPITVQFDVAYEALRRAGGGYSASAPRTVQNLKKGKNNDKTVVAPRGEPSAAFTRFWNAAPTHVALARHVGLALVLPPARDGNIRGQGRR